MRRTATLIIILLLTTVFVSVPGNTTATDEPPNTVSDNNTKTCKAADNTTVITNDTEDNTPIMLNNTQTLIIRNCTYIQHNYIIVEDSASLILDNATLRVGPSAPGGYCNYDLSFYDNAVFELMNSTLICESASNTAFYDTATMIAVNSTLTQGAPQINGNVYLFFENTSITGNFGVATGTEETIVTWENKKNVTLTSNYVSLNNFLTLTVIGNISFNIEDYNMYDAEVNREIYIICKDDETGNPISNVYITATDETGMKTALTNNHGVGKINLVYTPKEDDVTHESVVIPIKMMKGNWNTTINTSVFTSTPIKIDVDVTPPNVNITNITKENNVVTLQWNTTSADITNYYVKMDNNFWIPVGLSTSFVFYDVPEGNHTFYVKAEDDEALTTTVSKSIGNTTTVTLPEIEIQENNQTTTNTTIIINWTATAGSPTSFEISMDGETWTDIGLNTQHTFMLAIGENILYVRGKTNQYIGDPDNITITRTNNQGDNNETGKNNETKQETLFPLVTIIMIVSAIIAALIFILIFYRKKQKIRRNE